MSLTPEQTVLAIRAMARKPWAPVDTSPFHLSPCICGIPMWKQPCSVCGWYPTGPQNIEHQRERCASSVTDPRASFRTAIERSGDEGLQYEGNLATFYIRGWRKTCAWNRGANLDPSLMTPSYRRLTEEQAKFRIELQVLEIRAARIDCASPDEIFDTVCESSINLPRYYGEHFGLADIIEKGMTPETATDYVLRMVDRLVGYELIVGREDFTITDRGREVHRTYAFERIRRK